MIKQTLVRFDRNERDRLKTAFVHIRIAYPEYDSIPDRETRKLPARALGALGKGEAATQALAERAFEASRALLAACVEQSSVDYWRAELLQPVAAGAPAPAHTGRVPIIGDPEGVCHMLAETRATQARDAREALDVLAAALPLFADDADLDPDD